MPERSSLDQVSNAIDVYMRMHDLLDHGSRKALSLLQAMQARRLQLGEINVGSAVQAGDLVAQRSRHSNA